MARYTNRRGSVSNFNPSYFWQLFESYFGIKQQRGHITLAYGLGQEVFIATTKMPHRIYLEVCDNGYPICGGEQSTAAAVKIDGETKGFMIYADIKTDSCTIQWLSEKDQCHND